MSHALPYLRSRQKKTPWHKYIYTFVQLVRAPLEQHSKECTWRTEGPPSPTAVSSGMICMYSRVKVYSTYRLLGKTKVSKFQLSSRFSWGIQQVFWLQVSEQSGWNDFKDIFPSLFTDFYFIFNPYGIDGNLCAIFISWRYFTAWQISFIIKAASFSVKASCSGFSS